MANSTKELWECCEDTSRERSHLPLPLLDGLRATLQAGMSCEEIAGMLVVTAGMYEAMDVFEPEELVGRCHEIVRVIKGLRDVEHSAKQLQSETLMQE